jgi:clan AA aspartic protease
MLAVTGFFIENSPAINIKITGNVASEIVEVQAIIDTGFTGFVSMPVTMALPLGLKPSSTALITLADGGSQPKLVAEGTATIEDASKTGLIILEESSSEVLIGMDFLRTFRIMLIVAQETVLLVDQDQLTVTVQKISQSVRDRLSRAGNIHPPTIIDPNSDAPIKD